MPPHSQNREGRDGADQAHEDPRPKGGDGTGVRPDTQSPVVPGRGPSTPPRVYSGRVDTRRDDRAPGERINWSISPVTTVQLPDSSVRGGSGFD